MPLAIQEVRSVSSLNRFSLLLPKNGFWLHFTMLHFALVIEIEQIQIASLKKDVDFRSDLLLLLFLFSYVRPQNLLSSQKFRATKKGVFESCKNLVKEQENKQSLSIPELISALNFTANA